MFEARVGLSHRSHHSDSESESEPELETEPEPKSERESELKSESNHVVHVYVSSHDNIIYTCID